MRLSLLLLLAIAAQAAEIRVDHFTVCGEDLNAMRAQLSAAGIASEAGGAHSNHATEMALTSFPDGSYLESIAIQANGDPKAIAAHEWSKQMRAHAGPCAWAIRTADIAAERARLEAAHVAVGQPQRSGRNRPDGVRLDWETLQIGDQTRGTFFPFLIHDFSAREARAYPSGRATTNQFSGIAKVVIAVNDLAAAIALYRSAFSLAAPRRQKDAAFGADLAWFSGTPVVLAAPANGASWLSQRLRDIGEGPCAFVLKAQERKPASGAAWFGAKIDWFDRAKLGWRLGVE